MDEDKDEIIINDLAFCRLREKEKEARLLVY